MKKLAKINIQVHYNKKKASNIKQKKGVYMNVGKIGVTTQNYSAPMSFSGEKSSKTEYENPVSRETERNLAILSTVGLSAVVGAIAYGLTRFATNGKAPLWIAAAAAVTTAAINLPSKLYNTKVNVYVKEKEMDVFSRDRDLKTNLTEAVGDEVKNPEVSLDKKLDDNLKLQMANRGSAIGIANMTPQA